MNVGAMFGGIIMALTALAAVTVTVILRYREAAERDALTGLLNRRGFERAIGWMDKSKFAVITCDIDYFKRINDTLGHATGDRVLQDVAALLRSTLPENVHIARFGGEEFVACIPGCTLRGATRSPMLPASCWPGATGAISASPRRSRPVSASMFRPWTIVRYTRRSAGPIKRSIRQSGPAGIRFSQARPSARRSETCD